MPPTSKTAVGPLAIALEVEFLDRLAEPVRAGKAKSVSAIIRTALERYDFSDVLFLKPAQVSISVRLPFEVRRALKKVAHAKKTTVTQLVRAAVEAYLPELETDAETSAALPETDGQETPTEVGSVAEEPLALMPVEKKETAILKHTRKVPPAKKRTSVRKSRPKPRRKKPARPKKS